MIEVAIDGVAVRIGAGAPTDATSAVAADQLGLHEAMVVNAWDL